jgi:hypothetical protein
MPTEFAWIYDRFAMIQENNGNAENSRRSGRIARKSSIYAERKKQAEELETKLQVKAASTRRGRSRQRNSRPSYR